MTKPRIFIGSSRESMETARAVQDAFDYDAEVVVWDQGTFEPSEYPLESLERELDRADFGIFVFFPDDVTIMRGKRQSTVRDNVIFELGLFVGRLTRRRTFILTPRGADLHLPSDLSGITPVEYDPARDDQNMLAAVGPAARRIRKIIETTGLRNKPANAPALQAVEEQPKTEDETHDWRKNFIPRSGWERWEYENALWFAIIQEDQAVRKTVDAAFRKSKFGASEENLAEWEGLATNCQMRRGHPGAISSIQSSVDRFPTNPRLNQYLGDAAMHYGDYERASAAFEKTLAGAGNSKQVARAVELMAEAATGSRKPINRAAIMAKLLSLSAETGQLDQLDIARCVRTVAHSEALTTLTQSIDEVRLRLEPDNINLRFATAHQYDPEDADLSMIHYEAIPQSERSGTAWNNLGVAYSRLQVPAKGVSAYKKAAEKGETIAVGNLAQKLLTAGFVDEARERAERAIAVPGHHQNVVAALGGVAEIVEGENRRTDELRATALKKQAFMERLGLASLATETLDICGEWQTADCLVRFTSSPGGYFVGEGEYQEDQRGIIGGLFGATTKKTVRVSIRLRRLGNAFEGWITKTREDGGDAGSYGILSSSPSERPLAVFLESNSSARGRVRTYQYEDIVWARGEALLPPILTLTAD